MFPMSSPAISFAYFFTLITRTGLKKKVCKNVERGKEKGERRKGKKEIHILSYLFLNYTDEERIIVRIKIIIMSETIITDKKKS